MPRTTCPPARDTRNLWEIDGFRWTHDVSSGAVPRDWWHASVCRTFQALQAPLGNWIPPTRPCDTPYTGHDDSCKQIGHEISWWIPLFWLTTGVLGWARPQLGIHRWLEMGMPGDDGALTVIKRWYGADAASLVEFCRQVPKVNAYSHITANVPWAPPAAEWTPPPVPRGVNFSDDLWAAGGSDALHIGHFTHLFQRYEKARGQFFVDPTDGRQALLTLSHYEGWVAELAHHAASTAPRTRVQVVVPGVGHLGTYRRSWETGRWFHGRHRWHILGWPGPAGIHTK